MQFGIVSNDDLAVFGVVVVARVAIAGLVVIVVACIAMCWCYSLRNRLFLLIAAVVTSVCPVVCSIHPRGFIESVLFFKGVS
jgi:hypothetical protein